MKLKGLLFDLDGTLGDTVGICIEGFRRATLKLSGRHLTDEEVVATFGPAEEGSALVLAPHDPERWLDEYLAAYEEMHHDCTEPFPGVVSMLERLKEAGVQLALVTGKGPRTCEVSMRYLGLNDHFSEVRVGCKHGSCKTEMMREITAMWGFEPGEVGYVGDAPKDVECAREAGVVAISAAWAESADPEALQAMKPDALFRAVGELEAWMAEA